MSSPVALSSVPSGFYTYSKDATIAANTLYLGSPAIPPYHIFLNFKVLTTQPLGANGPLHENLIDNSPDPVRWLILDAGGLDDIDYSAGVALAGLFDYLDAHQITFAMARVDPWLVDTLRAYDVLDRIGPDRLYDTLAEAVDAFRRDTAVSR